jgi:hypothetical protein
MAIWQDLVDDHGFGARYAIVGRFVVALRGASSPEARVVIATAPGEEGQIYNGDGSRRCASATKSPGFFAAAVCFAHG